ncbi:MAG TPA: tRNA uridine-5-carboxymethylaminomethyl(34) synthesis GTPase MnmE, partial [Fusibacter sp.]|nr:tRNA uridine-5-carboxymethylaminomethyl(34) synthesis GTPase MnmE [Fusibacter sp.]
ALINETLHDKKIIKTSMELEIGIGEVEKAIQDMVLNNEIVTSESEIVSNTRHIHLLETAYRNVCDAKKAVSDRLPYDFIEVDIKDGILNLGMITGESVEKDLLNNIFSNFCLGK